MARKSGFTQPIADEICARLKKGETLRSICRDKHMPAWETVYDWRYKNSEFDGAIARARDIGHDAIAEETIDIVDANPATYEIRDKEGNVLEVRVDSALVQWTKNRVEQRLKLLAKWNPKRYGDRISHEVSGPGFAELMRKADEPDPADKR